MDRARYLARRFAVALVAVYLVLSVSFLFIGATPDPGVYVASGSPGGGAVGVNSELNVSEAAELYQQERQAYIEAKGLDDPVYVRYARWMWNALTLRWGPSEAYRAPVATVLGRAVPATLAYVVPALVLSVLLGLGLGVLAALHRGELFDRLTTTLTYVGFGIPDFYLGTLLLYVVTVHLGLVPSPLVNPEATSPLRHVPLLTRSLLMEVILPTLVLTTSLLAAQVRYARAASLEHVGAEFLAFVRAKGAGPIRIARHLVRNASVLLVSLFFAETVAVLVMNVYVIEVVFGIQGLGQVSFIAIQERDIALVLGTVMVFAFVGIAGNLVQDVLYAFLDPRLEDG